MNAIVSRINYLQQRINDALVSNKRPEGSVQLLAVSKNHDVDKLQQAYQAGIHCFGENRLQEAIPKIEHLSENNIEWHFIGRLQSNKIDKICRYFSWIHTVDSEAKAHRISNTADKLDKSINVCIQVNIDNDNQKAGVSSEQALALVTTINQLPCVNLRGLMTVLQKHDKLEQTLKSYQRMQRLFLQAKQQNSRLDTLSMGMSSDFELAIAAGATIVRIGTEIFGARQKGNDE